MSHGITAAKRVNEFLFGKKYAFAGMPKGFMSSTLENSHKIEKLTQSKIDTFKSSVKSGVDGKGISNVKYGEQYTKVNGKKSLKPNIQYTTKEGYKYTTDGNGRISSCEAKLELGKASRNSYAQRIVGREDRLPNDDGGHIIASIFKGSGDIDNLVPMNATLNRSEYKVLENAWKRALDEGKEVTIKVKPIYDGKSLRPSEFKINYSIDGKKYSDRLTNYPGGQ